MSNFFFEYFSKIIIVFSFLFILINILIFRKDTSGIFNSINIFLIVVLYFLYKIPQGFDISDEGLSLTKSWFMLKGAWHENIDMIWAVSFINGLWLHLAGVPKLLWARIGFALTFAVNSLLVFNILKLYFLKKESFLVVFLISILIPFGMTQTVSYQNLPVVFTLYSTFLFLKGNLYKKNIIILFSGIFSAFVFALKFPLIITLLYFGLFFLINFIWKKSERKIILTNALFYFYGTLIGFFILFIVLYSTHSIDDYIISLIGKFKTPAEIDPTHTLPNLINVYLNDMKLILIRLGILSVYSLLVIYIWKFLNTLFFKISFIVVSGILLYGFAMKFPGYFNWMYTILAFELNSLFLFLIFNFKEIKKYFPIIFFAFLMFFSAFAGSDMGFRLHMWSGVGVFFGSVFLILLLRSSLIIKNTVFEFKHLFCVFFVFLFLLGINLYSSYVYRDDNRNNLTYSFHSETLKGIKSTEARVNAVDSLINYFDKNINENQQVAVIGTMPMLYYLLDKKPVFKDLWRQPVSEFENYKKKNNIPEVFIFPLKNPRYKKWPVKSSVIRETDSINIVYYKSFIMSNTYKNIYKNSMFEIFKKYTEISD